MKDNNTKSKKNTKNFNSDMQEENLTTEYLKKWVTGEKNMLQQQEPNKHLHENSYTNRQYKDRLFTL